MLDVTRFKLPDGQNQAAPVVIPISPLPMGGAALSRLLTGKSPVQRAFVAADLHIGRISLIRPTIAQSAILAGAGASYICAALRHDSVARSQICSGLRPMVTPKPTRSAPVPVSDDEALVAIVHRLGVDRVIDIATTIEPAAAV